MAPDAHNNSRREHLSASVILILMGALATFSGFVMNGVLNDLHDVEQHIVELRSELQEWKERVLPHDTWQSTSLGEMDRFLEMFWNRQFPNEPYPPMRMPPPIVKP